jgi:hypothetical protein
MPCHLGAHTWLLFSYVISATNVAMNSRGLVIVSRLAWRRIFKCSRCTVDGENSFYPDDSFSFPGPHFQGLAQILYWPGRTNLRAIVKFRLINTTTIKLYHLKFRTKSVILYSRYSIIRKQVTPCTVFLCFPHLRCAQLNSVRENPHRCFWCISGTSPK